jgi:hypothetical protein
MILSDLVSMGEAMQEELGREYYLTGAGHKAEPAFQAIYRRYEALLGDEALQVVRDSGSPVLLEWLVELRTGRKTAHLDEQQLVWEQETVLDVDGQSVDYLRAPIELANSRERAYRIALDTARANASTRGLDALRRERFCLEHAEMTSLGLGSYLETLGFLSGIDFFELGENAAAFLDATKDMYSECLADMVRRRLGLPVSALTRADVAWAFRAEKFDRAFGPEMMLKTALRQMSEMDLDATHGGRVRFDTEERHGKNPRAFCVPVQVPSEVYLVLRPQGGHGDYRTFWHELGHAMHFASASSDLPFEARWLGDNSVTEGFAMLWDHLTVDRLWLRRYVDLKSGDVQTLTHEFGVHELYLVRRYAAKLIYELSLHNSDFTELGPEYAERLTAATLFTYTEHDCLSDVDPGLYCARYLRAWQLEAVLSSTLVDRFDSDWFRNPRAGAFIHELMSLGQSQPAHVLASTVAGMSLTFEPLLERIESALG